MNYDEIVKQARSESPTSVTFDMRKFPDAQGEALEVWLQNTGMGLQMGVLKHTKPIILLCDSKAVISPRADQLLGALKAGGVDVRLQRQD